MSEGPLSIRIESDTSDIDADLNRVAVRADAIDKETKAVEERARFRFSWIQNQISAVSGILFLLSEVTGQTIDLSYVSVINSYLALASQVSTFAAAQASMGNFAYALLITSTLGAIGASKAFVEQQRSQAWRNFKEAQERDRLTLSRSFQ